MSPPDDNRGEDERNGWTHAELRTKLSEFEVELRRAGLKESSIRTYVDRSEVFVRWLGGEYVPRSTRG